MADPASPQRGNPSHPYTSNGHNSAERPKPATTYRNGGAVSCTPRNHPLPASDTRIAGAPTIAMRSQGSAAVAMSAEPAMTDTSGTATACTTTTINAPSASASQVACTPSATAEGRSAAPKWRAERAVVPYDKNVRSEPTKPRTNPPIASPARLSAPNRPTTAVSNSK